MSSLLKRINKRQAIKGTAYTPEEIDNHEYAENIWATIASCKREAQEMVRDAYDKGFWDGKEDRDYDC